MLTHRSSVRVVLVTDDPAYPMALTARLSELEGVIIVAVGRDLTQAIDLCRAEQPDAVIIGLRERIVFAVGTLAIRFPYLSVIAVCSTGESANIDRDQLRALSRTRCLPPTAPAADFMTALTSAVNEQSAGRAYNLTTRELDILRALSLGLSNPEIAAQLNIATATVRFHTANIIAKLGAHNRVAAIVMAVRARLI